MPMVLLSKPRLTCKVCQTKTKNFISTAFLLLEMSDSDSTDTGVEPQAKKMCRSFTAAKKLEIVAMEG